MKSYIRFIGSRFGLMVGDRDQCIREVGFGIPSSECIGEMERIINETGVGFVEIGAGSGVVANILSTMFDVPVIATDPQEPLWFNQWKWDKKLTEPLDAITALQIYNHHNVLSIWPHVGGHLKPSLSFSMGKYLCLIGEPKGGVTDCLEDGELGYKLVKEVPVLQWEGCHDKMFVYRKKQ